MSGVFFKPTEKMEKGPEGGVSLLGPKDLNEWKSIAARIDGSKG
jgi:hypothetical protein